MMITKEDFEEKYGGKKNDFSNWEDVETALQSEEWVPVFSEFKFSKNDIDKHFTYLEVSNNYYPKKETFLAILEMCGIELISEEVDYVQRSININPLLCRSLEDEEIIRLMDVSVKVTKSGIRLCGDGRHRPSGNQSAEHPYWDKAVAIWNKEEEFSEGYSRDTYKTKQGATKKIFFKYNNRYKRKVCLDQLKVHALAIARTKAVNAVCSTLAGLPTGFSPELLSYGCFGFVKFVRSPNYQKMYTMAMIDAIRKGNTEKIQDTSSALFGPKQIEAPEFTGFPHDQDLINEKSKIFTKDVIYKIIQEYYNRNSEIIDKIPNAKDYFLSIDITSMSIDELKRVLQKIEGIPGIQKINHSIVLEEGGIF